MLEFVIVVLFCWLFFKAAKLVFRMAWGLTKGAVSLVMAIAVPLLGICLFFGGLALLVPVVLIGLAFGLLKALT